MRSLQENVDIIKKQMNEDDKENSNFFDTFEISNGLKTHRGAKTSTTTTTIDGIGQNFNHVKWKIIESQQVEEEIRKTIYLPSRITSRKGVFCKCIVAFPMDVLLSMLLVRWFSNVQSFIKKNIFF